MSARPKLDEYEVYVRGMTTDKLQRNELFSYGESIWRAAAEAVVTPHAAFNNQGGNAVCMTCWQGFDHKVHKDGTNEA